MEKKIAYKVSIVTIVANLFLTIIKLLAGILGSSTAMISDSIHSASDVFSTLIVIVGVAIAHKKSDKEHPYGHEKFECLAAIILAVLLVIVGTKIGINGIKTIIDGTDIKVPSVFTLIVAIISIITKEIMYRYTKRAAIKINSNALLADAWHHRSDSLSSIGAFIGILGSLLGLSFFDSLASIIISFFILKVAYDILKDALNQILDHACSEETIDSIKELVLSNEEVLTIDDLKTRLFGSKMYVDLEIGVDSKLTLIEAHKIAEDVHKMVEEKFPHCKHCMVHVNPKEK